MKKKPIEYEGFEGMYEVYEDGRVFSYRKKRFLKPSLMIPYYYVKYFLTGIDNHNRKWFGAHQLVAHHFIGPCPKGMEVHHIDHNKQNNHYSNLEYVTRSENILRSYRDNGRVCYWKGKKKGPHSPETLAKMSAAKEKPVLMINLDTKEEIRYKSIYEMIRCKKNPVNDHKMINRIMKSGARYTKKGYNLFFHFL